MMTTFRRKIYAEMLDWKERYSSRYALLIEGARRVGKTTIAEEFARNEFENHLLIDFTRVGEETKQQFRDLADDLDALFRYLQFRYSTVLKEGKSVIIFDEAQMLPVPYLRPCVWAISQLIAHYRVSAVLCTATQPALNPLFQEFLPGCAPVELCPDGSLTDGVFRRVTFRRAGKLTWDDLARELNGQTQVLCIVNSRKSAQTVFSRLTGERCFHLSTLMYPAHRQARLKEIRRRLESGLPCRVVSTSLIEAGVDVDFPAVWREEAGLDSILQAAGRCNREGRRPAGESAVTIFQGEDRPPKLFDTQIAVGREVLERQEDPASPQAIHDYFHQLLEVRGQSAQDKEEILKTMERELFPFRTVAEQFRMIEENTRTVYIPAGEGAKLIERLRSGERSRSLFRKLGRYGVSVYENHFQALDRAGALELLEDGSAILADLGLYDRQTGLPMEVEEGRGILL